MHMHCKTEHDTPTLRLYTTPQAALASPLIVCRNAAHNIANTSALQTWHGHRYLASPFDGGGSGDGQPTLELDMSREGTAFVMDTSSANGIEFVDCSGRSFAVLANHTGAAVGFVADTEDLGDDCCRWQVQKDVRPHQIGGLLFKSALTGEFLVIH